MDYTNGDDIKGVAGYIKGFLREMKHVSVSPFLFGGMSVRVSVRPFV